MCHSYCCNRGGQHNRLIPICNTFFYSTWPSSFSSHIKKREESDGGHRIKWSLYIGIKRLWGLISKGQSNFNSNNHCRNVGLAETTLAYLLLPCEDSHTNYVIRYLMYENLFHSPYLLLLVVLVLSWIWWILILYHNKRNCYTNTWMASSAAQKNTTNYSK